MELRKVMNQKNLFCIAALKIGKECSELIRKNLKPGLYLFNNRCRLENDKIVLNSEFNIEDNIYGENIFLHAIVGMNGSGKSSLLELIYRMVNNFSYMVDQKKEKDRIYFLFVILMQNYIIQSMIPCISLFVKKNRFVLLRKRTVKK